MMRGRPGSPTGKVVQGAGKTVPTRGQRRFCRCHFAGALCSLSGNQPRRTARERDDGRLCRGRRGKVDRCECLVVMRNLQDTNIALLFTIWPERMATVVILQFLKYTEMKANETCVTFLKWDVTSEGERRGEVFVRQVRGLEAITTLLGSIEGQANACWESQSQAKTLGSKRTADGEPHARSEAVDGEGGPGGGGRGVGHRASGFRCSDARRRDRRRRVGVCADAWKRKARMM